MRSSRARSDGRPPTPAMSWKRPQGASPGAWPRQYILALPATPLLLRATRDSAGGVGVGWLHDRWGTPPAPPNGYTDRRHPPRCRGRSPTPPELTHTHAPDRSPARSEIPGPRYPESAHQSRKSLLGSSSSSNGAWPCLHAGGHLWPQCLPRRFTIQSIGAQRGLLLSSWASPSPIVHYQADKPRPYAKLRQTHLLLSSSLV